MKYHSVDEYILNPPHKITVCLIGCGGTGSQVLSILARMNTSLIALNHPGLHVTVYDDDRVSEANLGRQLFAESEIGSYKAISLVSKMNRFYGTNWEAVPLKIEKNILNYNIYITCIDDFKARLRLSRLIKGGIMQHHENQKYYWLDFGNTNESGQAILGTLHKTKDKMPCFDEWVKLYDPPEKSNNVPSCSLAEALEKQDLLINSTLANAGMQLLWRLFREGRTPYSGVMLNLDTLNLNPILI